MTTSQAGVEFLKNRIGASEPKNIRQLRERRGALCVNFAAGDSLPLVSRQSGAAVVMPAAP
jgi:hypothetical protein